MKFLGLILVALSLYGTSEFSVNPADYSAEFSTEATQNATTVKDVTVPSSQKKEEKKNVHTSQKKEEVNEGVVEPKLSGYILAQSMYGKKVVQAKDSTEAKKLAKSKSGIVPYAKLEQVVFSKQLDAKFKKATFIIMMPKKTRDNGEILYTIYFFKKG